MVRAWCLTRSNGQILGLGPNSLPQVYRTREQARSAQRRVLGLGHKNITVTSTDELTATSWAVESNGSIVGNGITSVPMVFRTREQAREAARFASVIGKVEARVVRFGASTEA